MLYLGLRTIMLRLMYCQRGNKMIKFKLKQIEDGKWVQCCPKRGCKYMSPVVTNGKFFIMCVGLKIHLKRKHDKNK